MLKGHGECVSFGGKKWLATTKGVVVFQKDIPNFKPDKNWALEYHVYFSPKGYEGDHKIYLFVGKEGSPISVGLAKYASWWKYGELAIPNEAGLPNELKGQVVKIALKKEQETVHIFVNDVRSLSAPVDVPSLSALQPRIVVKMEGVDLGRRRII